MQIIGMNQAITGVINLGKQIKFATARALNDTGKEIQDWTLGRHLPDKFTLRAKGNPWQRPGTKFGFNLKFASKTNLEAVLGSQADWLREQEFGGRKQVAGGHRVAIPTSGWKARPEIMQRAKKPRRVLAGRAPGLSVAQRAFIARGRSGEGIFVRTGEGRKIRRLFTFEGSVQIKPILKWEPSAYGMATRIYQKHFDRRIVEAIATAKLV